MVSAGAGHDSFTVDSGEIVFVPKGFLHHIENINQGETKFAIAFNHERPEDIGISGSTGSMTDNVLGHTFRLGSEYFSECCRIRLCYAWKGKDDYLWSGGQH